MGWFTGSRPAAVDPQIESLADEIRTLAAEVAALRGERDGLRGQRELEAESLRLKSQIETLKMEKDRLNEDNGRKIREAEHTAGLHRAQAAWESKKAGEEAVLAVRTENLTADRTRFEEQMAFHKDQISGEVERFEGLLTALLARLPEITIEKSISQTQKG